MKEQFQLGGILLSALSCALAGGVAFAQRPNQDRPPQRQQQSPPPRQQSQPPRPSANSNRPAPQNPNASRPANRNPEQGRPQGQPRNRSVDRPPTRQNVPQPDRNFQRNDNRPSSVDRPPTIGPNRSNNFAPNNRSDRPTTSYDRPNNAYSDRPGTAYSDRPNTGSRMNRREQAGSDSGRPFVDQMRALTPQQRERVLQNSRTFQNLAPEQQNRIRNQFNQWDRMNPQQRADLREKENTWRRMTPQQRDYVKNDVMPRWRQVPWQRQQMIQQKLGVLQNMPEGARNRRLADPNFTQGMSDEDKAMLHDLSHLHVGGAPDPPSNEP